MSLQQPMYDSGGLSDRLGLVGVAVGLAWTSAGGEVLVVEATRLPCPRGREGALQVFWALGVIFNFDTAKDSNFGHFSIFFSILFR